MWFSHYNQKNHFFLSLSLIQQDTQMTLEERKELFHIGMAVKVGGRKHIIVNVFGAEEPIALMRCDTGNVYIFYPSIEEMVEDEYDMMPWDK